MKVGDKVIIKFSGFESTISEVITCPHCVVYKIEPKDPNDFGAGWYFKHMMKPTK